MDPERRDSEPPPPEHAESDVEVDVFTRWGSGPLLLFTFGCLILYEVWIAILWDREARLGAWGLAVAPILGVLLPVAWVIRLARVPVREQLWLYGLSAPQLLGVLMASLGAVPVCYAAGALNASWTPPDPGYYELFQPLAPTDFVTALGGFFAVVVCVPLGEEVIFRFLLLGVLARHVHALAAVVATGVLFAAAHAAPFILLPIGVLGIILGLMTVWSRTLTAAWIGHAVFNSFAYAELCFTGDAQTTAVEEFVLRPVVLVLGTALLVGGLAVLRAQALASAHGEELLPARTDAADRDATGRSETGHDDP